MAKIIKSKSVFFGGMNVELVKGNEVQDSSALVKKFPELFEISKEQTPQKKKPVNSTVSKTRAKTQAKEELLVEAPIAPAKVSIKKEVKGK